MGLSPRDAVRRVGLNPNNGTATKYEKKPRIQARILYWRTRNLTEEQRLEKRKRLEERLERAAYFNILEHAEFSESGEPAIDWKALGESEYGIAISEFRFDKDTGRLVQFKRDAANDAIAQLREMHGWKAPTRIEQTGKDGGPIQMDVSKATDEQLDAIEAVLGPLAGPAGDDPAGGSGGEEPPRG